MSVTLTNLVKSAKGISRAVVTYRSKGTGEVARYSILFGNSIEAIYRLDLVFLNRLLLDSTLDTVTRLAISEIIATREKSLAVGIGNNPNYTCKDVYVSIAPGIKLHAESGKVYLDGACIEKVQISPPIKPYPKAVSEKAQKKAIVSKMIPSGAWRTFAVDNVQSVASVEGTFLIVSA